MRGDENMETSVLRIGIAGCGQAARIHVDRLLAQPGLEIVGCADSLRESAERLAGRIAEKSGKTPAVFSDYRELLEQSPDILAVFTPHLSHYRLTMDALQAGCDVFVEKPLSTNSQEAADIVNLARGRQRKVGVGHQYRLRPSLIEARKRLAAGAVGPLRLVTAVLAQPWLAKQEGQGAESSWRFDPKIAGGGLLSDAGDHLVDALLWTTGLAAHEVFAVQSKLPSGLDVVTAATIRLAGGAPATLALSGVSRGNLFELTFFGDRGRLRATDDVLEIDDGEGPPARQIELPSDGVSIDGNFLAAVRGEAPLSCPADEALDTVRLSEAIARSAASGQVVQVI
jgi:predicted dehydrogenase